MMCCIMPKPSENMRHAASWSYTISGASATTLPLWSVWEARRTLGLPRRVTPVSVVALGWPLGAGAPSGMGAPSPLAGNVVHLDRWGHQPFRARRDPAPQDTA